MSEEQPLTPEQKKTYVSRNFATYAALGMTIGGMAIGYLHANDHNDLALDKVEMEIANKSGMTVKARPTFEHTATCTINSRVFTALAQPHPVVRTDDIAECASALSRTGQYKPILVTVPASYAIKQAMK